MKNIELNEVYTLKISSGEEIVAKIVNVDDGVIEISSPLSVAPSHQGMGLVSSVFTADTDKNIMLNTNTVIMYALTADHVRIKYIEATTGITTASKKIVLG